MNTLHEDTLRNPPDPTSLTRPPDHPEESTVNGPTAYPMTHFTHEDFGCDSSCSTPYVSAPSSPGRPGSGPALGGFFYSCPPSPMHFSRGGSFSATSSPPRETVGSGHEFEFLSGGLLSSSGLSSADELFLNGKIRPMKLSTHLESPQDPDPLSDLDNERRRRDVRNWSKSRSRRTRSMSPLRSSSSFGFLEEEDEDEEPEGRVKIDPLCDGSRKVGDLGLESGCIGEIGKGNGSGGGSDSGEGTTSRSSSAGRNSRRWEFLKDLLLYRSKSEGRRSSNCNSNNNSNKFWSNISFSPAKEKKSVSLGGSGEKVASFSKEKGSGGGGKKPVNGGGVGGKRRGQNVSPHEMHYKTSRAQAEEMRKRTFLPYRQGVLGCLGFSSKGYGAMSGFARALNPVSSR